MKGKENVAATSETQMKNQIKFAINAAFLGPVVWLLLFDSVAEEGGDLHPLGWCAHENDYCYNKKGKISAKANRM